jgi:hypothetical protein
MQYVHIIICCTTYSNFLLSINSKTYIDNNYLKIPQLSGLPIVYSTSKAKLMRYFLFF